MAQDDGKTQHEPWTENRAAVGAARLHWRELWAYRELVAFFALRDLKVRYKQATFGVAWAVAQPLAGALVFTLVFQRLADLPSDGIPYTTFAFLGFSVWSYFSSSVNAASASLVGNASLVTKVYFPRLAAPLAAVLPGLVDLAVALLILVPFMVKDQLLPGITVVVLPVCIIACLLVALGAGVLLATLNVQYRDVHHVIGLLMQLWLFASPVVYPSSLIPADWRWVYFLNPMAGVIDGFRWSLLGGPGPGWRALISLLSGLILLAVGIRCFQRAERRFADVI